ncbi:MAG: ComF family protein [Bacteroidetes bacterium]|nr:ComF family protein [Bacteroidota bacterium]
MQIQVEEGIIDQIFYGKVPVQKACALFYFIKGGVGQSIIHHLKYKNKTDVGLYFGKMLGEQISQSFHFKDVDAIVPVPLSKSKRRKRGYNQSEKIARGISQSIQKPVLPNYLLRVKQRKSQTQYNKFTRWQNINHCFALNSKVEGSFRHILLVDDVITTGATIESCVAALLEMGNVKVSVASLAFAPQPL